MRPAVGLLLFYKEKSEENENMKNYKIAVAGTGYVGLSLSVLLAQHNQVMAVDIVQAKVDMIETLGDIIKNYDQIVAGMNHGLSSNNAKFNEGLEKIVEELFK